MAPSLHLPLGQPNGAAHHPVDIDGQNEGKRVTVLVTGFGPFQERFPVNPSFEIARRLPTLLPAPSPKHAVVRIIHYDVPIRVAFDTVRELVPQIHHDYMGTVDVVLHLGMASGRKYYCIERYAHRDGYGKSKDLDGKAPPPDEGNTIFADCPAVMTTSLDYDHIVLGWQRNVLGLAEGSAGCDSEIRESHDAGHYLCDYIYFNSLAHSGRQSGKMEKGDRTARPVLFMHVPAESDGTMLERGTSVTIALIRAIADSFAEETTGK